jgi:signal transduction histidine kinase
MPPISADPEQLKEVLVNLVVNACEAMKKGGKIVISEDETIERPFGKMVEIRVGDNGPGIPGHLIDKVLQPFFTTKEEGTGLGLSIASRIIEEHGGRLNMASSEGIGTTFTILLPVRN